MAKGWLTPYVCVLKGPGCWEQQAFGAKQPVTVTDSLISFSLCFLICAIDSKELLRRLKEIKPGVVQCITITSLKPGILTPSLIGCVTLGKSLNLSVLLFLHCRIRSRGVSVSQNCCASFKI